MAEVATSGSDELWDLPKKDKCRFLYAVMVSVTLIAPSSMQHIASKLINNEM